MIAIRAALEAGQAVMEVYNGEFRVEYKDDLSPLTLADKKAHEIILDRLSPLRLPVLSEEGASIPYSERKNWKDYWLVDPLDGTKDFVKRNGDFTVNIAYIRDRSPLAGIIYAPVKDLLYYGVAGRGAFRVEGASVVLQHFDSMKKLADLSRALPLPGMPGSFTIVATKSHRNPETDAYIKEVSKEKSGVTYLEVGSSLKFCSMAEGSAQLYPRLGPTMEWDTAAGHAIASIAGCSVREMKTGTELSYNKQDLLNPWFLVERK